MKYFNSDVIIAGSGAAGLFCALSLPKSMKITVISKDDFENSDSFLAQGGICMLQNDDDYDSFYEDTMKAGHYENTPESVDVMIRSSQHVIKRLVGYGVDFEKSGSSETGFACTREGAHSRPRILFHKDITGKEITSRLLCTAYNRSNITLMDHVTMTDIIVEDSDGAHANKICEDSDGAPLDNRCESSDNALADRRCEASDDAHANNRCDTSVPENEITRMAHNNDTADAAMGEKWCAGIKAVDNRTSEELIFNARFTVLATGGIGGLYENSTNFPHLTGDSIRIAEKHGIRLKDLDYVQIHPTTFYDTEPGRRFLISESVRGEGAHLYDCSGNRFVDELLPRDVVTQKILEQMEKDGTKHVMLDMTMLGEEEIFGHFPNIYKHCLEHGYDVTKERIPVVPAQHYFMGGVETDTYGATSMKNLYAVGETACNGVHGRNRLASNSLLESLVFAERAAGHISKLAG